jgi:hypothetical protein
MPSGAARRRGRWGAALTVLALGWAAGRPAHAQTGVSPPLSTGPFPALEEQVPPQPVARPRLSLAVGMGASLDASGFTNGAHAIPAFFGVGGFGDGLLGVDLGAFSSAASGRFHGPDDAPVDRLALDAFAVVRPAARLRPGDTRYRLRVLRTLAAEVGLGFERDGHTIASGGRFQVHTGARVELPLTAADRPSELRLRLAVRHALGLYTPEVSGGNGVNAVTVVGDSTELYAALAVVF